MDVDWKEVRNIAIAGACGGLLSWLYAQVLPERSPQEWWKVFFFMALGAGAAPVGVYVLANADMRFPSRALALAMVCGFAWKPVLDAGAAVIKQHATERVDSVVDEKLEELKGPESGDSGTVVAPEVRAERAIAAFAEGARASESASPEKRQQFLLETPRLLEETLKPLDPETREKYEAEIKKVEDRMWWKFRKRE